MATVIIESRNNPVHQASFNFCHEARTWLLLAGYLPVNNDNTRYVNLYTSEEAYIYSVGAEECE